MFFEKRKISQGTGISVELDMAEALGLFGVRLNGFNACDVQFV